MNPPENFLGTIVYLLTAGYSFNISGKYLMSYENTSLGWPQLSMLSIVGFLVFDLTIRQIVEDFRVRGAGDADH
jgi:hypothetical protein